MAAVAIAMIRWVSDIYWIVAFGVMTRKSWGDRYRHFAGAYGKWIQDTRKQPAWLMDNGFVNERRRCVRAQNFYS